MNAYIYCLNDDKRLNIRAGGRAFLADTFAGPFLSYKGSNSEWIVTRAKQYHKHDMLFFPINIPHTHWYLCVINARLRTIQILDSLGPSNNDRLELKQTIRGLEHYLDMAAHDMGPQETKWKDYRVTTWPWSEEVKSAIQKDTGSCGLFTLKFMECWTGFALRPKFAQQDIDHFRLKLAVILVNSHLNKIKESPGSRSKEDDAKPDNLGEDQHVDIDSDGITPTL
ncbi:uncharacterized protein LOC133930228 [Phragmites australis]|uniref:uncharacterized protein LOC133912974 n=1 Tax=Phragmites australis TaxID=29695 RepID=UPI002D78DA05|nr:uncharacterized protein LOC133912974 [Phragmites australis]XP_062232872.1 uncharacterized protein LOC133930228 [Phragmites australis]